jgi:branched-chain amino acid transport system substrate-binding protein
MASRSLAFSVVLGLAAATAPGSGTQGPSAQTSREPITIGAVLSLTGPGAGLGQPERNGILLAEKTINADGGIKGRPIRVLVEDDGSKADVAKSKAESLIFDANVIAMLGPSLTASTGAVSAVTNAQAMAEVAFTGLGPKIETTYKTLYHVLPPQDLNARAMLEYTSKALKVKRVGVLHDTGYGQVVANALNVHRTEYGIDFVGIEKFDVGATDVSAQAAKIRAAEPEAVFVIATSSVPFRNARQVKLSQPIVSAIGSASYDYVRGMGEFANDIVFPEFLVGEDPKPEQAEFVKLYLNAYGSLPKNFEAAGWDALKLLASAIEVVGPTASRQQLAQAVRGPFAGVLARYNFAADDMTGIDLSSYVFSKLVKGSFSRLPFVAK